MKIKGIVHIGAMLVIASAFYFFIGCDPANPVPETPIFDNAKIEIISPGYGDPITTGGMFRWDEPGDADCVLGIFTSEPTVTNGVLDTTDLIAGSKTGLQNFGNGNVALESLYRFDGNDFDTAQSVSGLANGVHYWAVWCFKNGFLSHSSPPWTATITWP